MHAVEREDASGALFERLAGRGGEGIYLARYFMREEPSMAGQARVQHSLRGAIDVSIGDTFAATNVLIGARVGLYAPCHKPALEQSH